MAATKKSASKTATSRTATPKAIEPEEMHFRAVADALAHKHPEITWGKMMSSPGIRYGDKFFAFYYKQGVVFRFGRDFAPESVGVTNYTLLSPFKTKPPLRDWFCITADDQDRWGELAHIAMQKMAVEILAQQAKKTRKEQANS